MIVNEKYIYKRPTDTEIKHKRDIFQSHTNHKKMLYTKTFVNVCCSTTEDTALLELWVSF